MNTRNAYYTSPKLYTKAHMTSTQLSTYTYINIFTIHEHVKQRTDMTIKYLAEHIAYCTTVACMREWLVCCMHVYITEDEIDEERVKRATSI